MVAQKHAGAVSKHSFFAGKGTAESRFRPPKSWEVEEDCHIPHVFEIHLVKIK